MRRLRYYRLIVWFLSLWLPIQGFAAMGMGCCPQDGYTSTQQMDMGMQTVVQNCSSDQGACAGMEMQVHSRCTLCGGCAIPAIPISAFPDRVLHSPSTYVASVVSAFKSHISPTPHRPPIASST